MCIMWHSFCLDKVIFVTSGQQILHTDPTETGMFITDGREMPKHVEGLLCDCVIFV